MNATEKSRKQHDIECLIRVSGCCYQNASCDATCRYFGYAQYVREEKQKYAVDKPTRS